jgi:hypothetical protein
MGHSLPGRSGTTFAGAATADGAPAPETLLVRVNGQQDRTDWTGPLTREELQLPSTRYW